MFLRLFCKYINAKSICKTVGDDISYSRSVILAWQGMPEWSYGASERSSQYARPTDDYDAGRWTRRHKDEDTKENAMIDH